MLLIIIGIILYTMAFVLYTLTYIFPIFRMVYLDWIALFIAIVPYVIVLYRIHVTRCWHHVDKLPIWKHLINYLRRDNEVIPVVGERAYPGESFIDVDKLGLIEFLGKDCVYQWGDKKIVWGLENINFTPDPRYFNLTHLLYEVGFTDTNDVTNVLKGEDLDLMGRVYMNIIEYDDLHGASKLMTEMEEYDGKIIEFKPVPQKGHKDIAHFLDRVHIGKKEK